VNSVCTINTQLTFEKFYSKGRGYLVEKRRETLGTEMGDASSFATHLSKAQIFEAVDASLKRLQVCVCCGVLRCVAVCCSLLQCVAVEGADL